MPTPEERDFQAYIRAMLSKDQGLSPQFTLPQPEVDSGNRQIGKGPSYIDEFMTGRSMPPIQAGRGPAAQGWLDIVPGPMPEPEGPPEPESPYSFGLDMGLPEPISGEGWRGTSWKPRAPFKLQRPWYATIKNDPIDIVGTYAGGEVSGPEESSGVTEKIVFTDPIDIDGLHYGGEMTPDVTKMIGEKPDDTEPMTRFQYDSFAGGELPSEDMAAPQGPDRDQRTGDYTTDMKIAAKRSKELDRQDIEESKEKKPFDTKGFDEAMTALMPAAKTAMRFPETQAQILAKTKPVDISKDVEQSFLLPVQYRQKEDLEKWKRSFKTAELLQKARKAIADRQHEKDLATIKADKKFELQQEKDRVKRDLKMKDLENKIQQLQVKRATKEAIQGMKGDQKLDQLDVTGKQKIDQINLRGEIEKAHQERENNAKWDRMGFGAKEKRWLQKAKDAATMKRALMADNTSRWALQFKTKADKEKAAIKFSNDLFLQKDSQDHALKKQNLEFTYDMDKMGRAHMFDVDKMGISHGYSKELLDMREQYAGERQKSQQDFRLQEIAYTSEYKDWLADNQLDRKLFENDQLHQQKKDILSKAQQHDLVKQGRGFQQQNRIQENRLGHAQAVLASKFGHQLKMLDKKHKLNEKTKLDILNKKMAHDYKLLDKRNAHEAAIAKSKADAELNKVNLANMMKETSGEKKVNQEFGKQWIDWKTRDKHTVNNGIKKLKKVRTWLQESMDGRGDSISGFWMDFKGETLRKFFSPRAEEAQRLVRQVTTLDLKKILGGQFAMREGEMLLKTTFDQAATEMDNFNRIDQLIKMMEGRKKEIEQMGNVFDSNRGNLSPYFKAAVPNITEATQRAANINIHDGMSEEEIRAAEELLNQVGY